MQSNIAPEGMVVTPHHLATQSALKVLKDGGTAIDAIVAAAATIAVVYPHMNSIGGDGFWLIIPPHGDPIAIEACGAAGSLATDEFFAGLDKIPYKGPKSAITVAGTVGGWEEALKYGFECGYARKGINYLLADAIKYAENGFPIGESCRSAILTSIAAKDVTHDFSKIYIPDRKVPEIGDKCYQKELATTLRCLASQGLQSFYNGEVAKKIDEDLKLLGLPITMTDLQNYCPVRKTPLRMLHDIGDIFNLQPPTQGVISLLVLGILEKLEINGKDEGKFIHATVEATKIAFEKRDEFITDPNYMKMDPKSLLTFNNLSKLASTISFDHKSSIGTGKGPGDTVWMGAMDKFGFSVSFIQSIYHVFGSGIVLPKTGIIWHNRGVAFSLQKDHILSVNPGKKPFHTLSLAAAKFHDGRVMIYGTRGGDGQPQTQAAIFHRYAIQKKNLQVAVSSPRWIYGSNSGDKEDVLKLEGRFDKDVINYLRDRGHIIQMLPDYSEVVGQAGALVRHPNGMMEGAFDPRSDGSAAGY